MAQRLAEGLRDMPGVTQRYPVQSNSVFAALDPRLIEPLQREWGFKAPAKALAATERPASGNAM